MENINTKENNINDYEIELSENFMSNDNKDFLDYSSIPSNYGKITNTDIENELNDNNISKISKDYISKFTSLWNNIFAYIKKLYIQLSFNWCYDIIKKGRNTKLTLSSFKEIPSNYSSEKLFKEIYSKWQKIHNKNNQTSHILLKILLKIHFNKLLLVSILLLIRSLLDFGGIIVYNELLKRFNFNESSHNKEYDSIFNLRKISLLKLIIYMIVYAPVTFILHFQCVYICEVINSCSQSQLKFLIYDKVFKKATYIQTNLNQGKIINLVQSDSNKFGELISSYWEIFDLPLKIFYSIFLLLCFYGYTIIPCIIILMILCYLFYHFGKKQNKYENALMEVADRKMNIISQTFNIIKIIKLYVWEKLFINKIDKVKEEENIIMRKKANMTLIVNSSYWNTETILVLIAIIFYFIKYQNLDNSNLLTTMFIFYNIIDPLYSFPSIITNLNDTFISLKRIQKFLEIQEHDMAQLKYLDDKSNLAIDINGINFGVYKNSNDAKENVEEDIDKKNKKDDDENDISLLEDDNNELIKIELLNNIEVKIRKGEHIGVIGKVGSGKSCLLNSFINDLAIINENNIIHHNGNNNILLENNNKNKFINITGKISYVTQNPWILNETIKNNILFFDKINEDKYKKIISICQLEPDLKIIKGGDKAEIGEKGINLSGGQKMRLAIARAVYNEAEIYIFDDPLSALDAYVGMNLFNEVFCEYLKNKTVIISTHSLQYLNNFDRIIFMEDGKIKWFGPPKEIYFQPFYDEFSKFIKNSEKNDLKSIKSKGKVDDKAKEKDIYNQEDSSKTILSLSNIEKNNNYKSNKQYLDSFLMFLEFSGGMNFVFKVIISNILWKLSQLISDFYISKWAKEGIQDKTNLYFKLFIFTILSLISIFGVIIRQKLMDDGLIRFNIKMHKTLIDKLIYASLNLFHNVTPKGKIYNLLEKDLEDSSSLNLLISRYLRNIFQIAGSIIICVSFNKWSILLIIFILYVEYLLTSFYIPSSKEINNLEANSRSPIIGVLEETLSGIPIIRSIKKEKEFKEKFYGKVKDHFLICLYQNGTYCWLIIHLSLINSLLHTFILIFCYLYKYQYDSQSVGLLMKYSILLTDQLFEIMQNINEFGKIVTSVSRCRKYTKIPQEKYYTNKTIKNNHNIGNNIFNEGKITFKNFNVKYGPKQPLVLKNISLEIRKGEKIGVVGRTGSGKTTFGLCLFRILEAESGKILIDDVDISGINLFDLRENISIIPQEPTLIEGSLRYNIDPYNKYSDMEINKLLNDIGLDFFMADKNLDYKIEENGNNISVGERQLICITRAFLKKNKIIVMDEATSSIDYKTEKIIQNTISKFMNNCTIITIAHRIKTIINYDRILVLSNGEIEEFDTPQNLINKKGLFYLLYKESVG